MKLGRMNHIGVVTPNQTNVIASSQRLRGNPESSSFALDCFVAPLLAMTKSAE